MTPLCRHNVNKYGGVRWDRGSISVWWVQPSALNNDVGLIDGRNDMSLLSCSKSIYVYSWRLTVFTARCMCIAGNVLSQDVCPFVCLSVTHRYYVETAKYIVFFSLAGWTHHFIYSTKRYGTIPTEPLMGHRMRVGYENIRDFRPIFRFISKMIQNRQDA